VGLADSFTRVVATDASADQLLHATMRPNIEYRQAGAEASGLPADSADLVTCAQAMHWLPRDAFFAEARRVLRRGSVIAVWGYHIPIVREQLVDAAIRHFHDVVVGPYWPPERRLVLDRFATIEFPFSQIAAPEFEMRCALEPRRLRAVPRHPVRHESLSQRPGRRPCARARRLSPSQLGRPSTRSGCVFSGLHASWSNVVLVPPFVTRKIVLREQSYEDLR
jgi:SAM-dependent methyltransferase